MCHLWFTPRLGPLTTSWCMRMEAKNSMYVMYVRTHVHMLRYVYMYVCLCVHIYVGR